MSDNLELKQPHFAEGQKEFRDKYRENLKGFWRIVSAPDWRNVLFSVSILFEVSREIWMCLYLSSFFNFTL